MKYSSEFISKIKKFQTGQNIPNYNENWGDFIKNRLVFIDNTLKTSLFGYCIVLHNPKSVFNGRI